VASNAEWVAAENFLGGAFVAGGKMKEADTLHWLSPNTAASNSSGFTGLPGGTRNATCTFEYIRENGLWWTNSSFNAGNAMGLYMWYLSPAVEHDPVPKKYGMNVRCLKQAPDGVGELKYGAPFSLTPNPAKELVTIDVGNQHGFLLQIFNLHGQSVMQMEFSERIATIDIRLLPAGTYVVRLITENHVARKILLREKLPGR
jgi:hypothetical protein